MDLKIQNCPLCNSIKIKEKNEIKKAQAPFGPEVESKSKYIECENCHEVFDISEYSDKQYEVALQKSTKESIIQILNYLTNLGHSYTDMERSLDLPYRTISRWKNTGEITAPGITLLRLLRLYPWLIDVAGKNYDIETSQQTLIFNAYSLLKEGFEKFLGPTTNNQALISKQSVQIEQTFTDGSICGFFFKPSNKEATINCLENNNILIKDNDESSRIYCF